MPAADIPWAVYKLKEQCQTVETTENYYDGYHDLAFASEKFRNAFGPLLQKFADNLCPAVVDAVAERLKVIGWDGKDADKAADLAKRVKLARTSAELFKNATRDGDSFLIVWKKNGKARFWPHTAKQVCVEYDENDPTVIDKAAKIWTVKAENWSPTNQTNYVRMTLYYEDHFEKYVTKQATQSDGYSVPDNLNSWERYSSTDDGNGEVENDYGMPVFHFGNAAELGRMGRSELHDVIPVQDALNKAVCDMLVAMEFVAYPQRYATGLQVEVDEDTGKPKNPPFTPGVDRIWTAAGEVKFGQFDPADLSGFLEVQKDFRAEVARVSGTPTHFMNLDEQPPTGEALKVSEGRLINKVENRQSIYSDPLVGAINFGLDLEGNGGANLDFMPVWASAAPHNPLLDAETQLVKQQVGVSTSVSLAEMGYDEAKIKEMKAEKDADAQKAADQALKQAQAGAQQNGPGGKPTPFNRNGPPGQPSKPAPMKQQQQKKPIGKTQGTGIASKGA